MDDNPHSRWMKIAMEQAAMARGRTRPNPLVGASIVRDGKLLALGYHRRAGHPHAELDALSHLEPGKALGADLYVNLEPCCTHGRTPPCTEAIIEAGIARVFVGTIDTNPRHREKGIALLREAGIEVVVGMLETEARRFNAPYFCLMEVGRPLVVAKWAMSLDGKIATASGNSEWITNESSREYVHKLRDRYDAVMVGGGTLRTDDPRLTCRIESGRDPLRVVIDTRLQTPPTARVYESEGTIVVHSTEVTADFAPLADKGAVSLAVETDHRGHVDLTQALEGLVEHDVMSVMVEGGGALLGSLFDADLVDRVYAFVAPRVVGGTGAITAVGGVGAATISATRTLSHVEIEQFGDDVVITGDF